MDSTECRVIHNFKAFNLPKLNQNEDLKSLNRTMGLENNYTPS